MSEREIEEVLLDPVAVHVNMLRGTIAKPSIANIIHLYGRDALLAALRAQDREDGAREMRERAAACTEREACACITDIVENDALGAAMAQARHGALLTSAGDIRALPLSPARKEDSDA